MLNRDDIDCDVLDDIESNLEGTGKEVENLTVEQAFEAFLTWNGIIGYCHTIIDALDSLRNAEIKS
jgi:hypothetical protein